MRRKIFNVGKGKQIQQIFRPLIRYTVLQFSENWSKYLFLSFESFAYLFTLEFKTLAFLSMINVCKDLVIK